MLYLNQLSFISPIKIRKLAVHGLLFVDDLVLIVDSPVELHCKIDQINM